MIESVWLGRRFRWNRRRTHTGGTRSCASVAPRRFRSSGSSTIPRITQRCPRHPAVRDNRLPGNGHSLRWREGRNSSRPCSRSQQVRPSRTSSPCSRSQQVRPSRTSSPCSRSQQVRPSRMSRFAIFGRDTLVVSGVLQLPFRSNDPKALRRDAKHRDSGIHTPHHRTPDSHGRAVAD